jgi:hypothetical protein
MVQGRLIVPLELINGDLIAVDGWTCNYRCYGYGY